MAELDRQIEEGKLILSAYAAAQLPDDVTLSWQSGRGGQQTLVASQGGRMDSLLSLDRGSLADIPESYHDKTGGDDHWPQMQAEADLAIRTRKTR